MNEIIEEMFPYGGYTVHRWEDEQEQELDLDKLEKEATEYFRSVCPDQETLDMEGKGSEYEHYCEAVGPWTVTVRKYGWETISTPFGEAKVRVLVDEHDVGYEGMSDTLEMVPDRWTAEYDGFREGQEEAETLTKMVDNAILHDSIEWNSDMRFEFFTRAVAWINKVGPRKVAQNACRFWKRLNDSRALCAKNNLWSYVLLTKHQANVINDLIRQKCGWKW